MHPGPLGYHQEIELEIETLTNEGCGLGRHDGWVVMVSFALPAERVRVRVYRNHSNFSEADLLEVLRVSPDRIAPVCPLFGCCGGCQYQNLAYPVQLEWKRRHVAEVLQRLARIGAPVEPVVASPRPFGYRSKITPHFDRPKGSTGPIGFLESGKRHSLVDVPQCPLATEAINAALPELRARVKREMPGRKTGATLLLREGCGGVTSDPAATITERVGDLELRFGAGDFFQNNPFILPLLVGHVVAEASGGHARFLVDAYCGSGLFALAAAKHFERVAGVEVSERAVLSARANAAHNGIVNCTFLAGTAEAIFAGLHFEGGESAVIIDPPRKGCDGLFLDQLFVFRPRRVVYVSCNPATQMRDLVRFVAAGYRVERVRPFDLFPQTKHLECVVTLERP